MMRRRRKYVCTNEIGSLNFGHFVCTSGFDFYHQFITDSPTIVSSSVREKMYENDEMNLHEEEEGGKQDEAAKKNSRHADEVKRQKNAFQ